MHPDYNRADSLTKMVIGVAIEVHRHLGPGLLESIYEQCLAWELGVQNIPYQRQVSLKIEYKGKIFDEQLRADLYVDKCLIIELKAVEQILPIHKAQLMTYMRLLEAPLGLIINFNEQMLSHGVSRMILPGANGQDG